MTSVRKHTFILFRKERKDEVMREGEENPILLRRMNGVKKQENYVGECSKW